MQAFSCTFLLILGAFWALAFGCFAVLSIYEKERRASIVSAMIAVGGGTFFSSAALLSHSVRLVIVWGIAGLVLLFLILFFLPIGKVETGNDIPHKSFDEREIMFARSRYQPGTEKYEKYYAMHPEKKEYDDQTRAKAGLLSPGSREYHPQQFGASSASFAAVHELQPLVEGQPKPQKLSLPVEKATKYIKGLAKYYGALDVGITELKPYHLYSHIGRGPGEWGAEIELDHPYAIAITVEMDYDMVGTDPQAPGVMESARQYLESGRAAVQLAQAIRNMGYEARAHIDGNYRVICPLVARDAGLGEIGRMTLLMTPKQGPRVRLAVITTDLTLNIDHRKASSAMIDFCNICKKCANNCPSLSISFEDREEIDGALRWKLNPDTCFRYWNISGTDCGICMRVCPYSHPDNLAHNLIRWGIARSGFFRRLALWMDDLFYGKKPAPRAHPEWLE